MADTQTAPRLKVYWRPGCSSCPKAKEFLLENGVEFESINVLEDETGIRDLEALGMGLVQCGHRADPTGLTAPCCRDVAWIAGFKWQPHDMLAPVRRCVPGSQNNSDSCRSLSSTNLGGTARCYAFAPSPLASLTVLPRLARYLKWWSTMLKTMNPMATALALNSRLAADSNTRDDLMHYAHSVQCRLNRWSATQEELSTDFNQPGNVDHGEVSLHEVLERTAWHSGHHSRQLMLALETIGIDLDGPLHASDFSGLPMPRNAWDNEKNWS